MITRGVLIWVTIAFLQSADLYAQKYNFKSYTVNDGLPSSNVYDLYTDESGYLWFATSVGVVRYDGDEYKIYGVENGLKDPLIYDFHFDKNNKLWVSTEFGGVAIFENGRFRYPPEFAPLNQELINFIGDYRDELWFGTTDRGVLIWDRKQQKFDSLTVGDGLPSNLVWDIYFNNDQIWIATMDGVVQYVPEIGIVEKIEYSDGLAGEFTYQVVADNLGNLWIATSDGISILNTNGSITNIVEINGIDLGYIFSISKTDDGIIWIGTERQGLFLYEDGAFTQIKKQNGLASNFIYRLIPDKNGNMWVATDGNGASLFKDRNFIAYDIDSPLGSNYVFSAKFSKDSSLWIGTDKGLSNYKDGVFTNYTIPEELFSDDEIWDIEELPNGNLLLLTYTYQFLEFDGEKFFIPAFYEQFYDVYINDVLVDRDGSIWISTFKELIHVTDNGLERFNPPDDYYWQVALAYMFQDSRGLLWIATEGGVALFQNGEFEYFNESHGVVGKSIYEIAEDPDGNLWLGSNMGISFASKESILAGKPKFNPFLENELITSETIFITFDQFGGLWQGTNSGINYIDISGREQNDTIRQLHFPLSETNKGVEMNGAARVRDANGSLWFGSNELGLISYNFDTPDGYVPSYQPPQIFLREVYSDNKLTYSQERDSINRVVLDIPFEENDLIFRFNTIDYLNPENMEVHYRLAGYDSDWQVSRDINEIRYTNVPNGNYELQMRAKSVKSPMSEVKTLASITVLKPFYLTFPFFALAASLFGLMVYVYVTYRVSYLEKKKLQQLVDLQTAEITKSLEEKEVLIKEIHHRVKNNLAVVSGLLELQGFRLPPGDAKQAIVESKMRVIAMSKIHESLYQNKDLANVDFRKFINELIKGVQTTMMMVDKDIKIIQHIGKIFLDVNMGVPVALIVNELVTNSYKHAFSNQAEGTITVQFDELDDHYELTVKDDGCGTNKDILTLKLKSLGLTLIRSLTAQLEASISYENAHGSTFFLSIPKTNYANNERIKKESAP